VATGAAEGSPRCVLGAGRATSGAAMAAALSTDGRKVGGRPGGVYWVPAST
jgi:hypothetical protein